MADWKVIPDSSLRHKHYNGGWQTNYESDLHGGYAGNDDNGKKHCTVIRFKSPVTGTYNLKFTIPFVRSDRNSKMVTEGTFYVKLQSTDITDIDKRPISSTSGVVTKNWAADDLEVHKVTVYKVGTFKKDSYYYLVINADSIIEVGHTGHDSDWYVGIDTSYHTAVGKGTVSITDNGNNTFTIKGTKGANGTNNPAKGFYLNWSYDSAKYDKTAGKDKNITNVTLECTTSRRTVYAKCITDATYDPDSEVKASKEILRYSAPNDPGEPVLTASSFKNNRLTVKQNWTYSWARASAVTANSPIKGYRIRIYKNGDQPADRILGLTASGKTITQGTGTADYVDVPTTTSDATAEDFSITFNPTNLGFKPGDTVQIGIFAWATNGAGAILWSGGGKSENQVMSDITPVQNSGVIRVKVKGEWKEGQVYVKTAGKWKEAETVLVKTPKGWKESE